MGPPPSTAALQATPLTRKLAQFASLSRDELVLLYELHGDTRMLQRHGDLVTEGRSSDSLFIVIEGIAISYRILHDGRRQIINIVLPGDVIGALGSFSGSSLYSTKALTELIIATIPFSRLKALFASHPRLIAKIFWSFSCDSAISAEHVIDSGRRSALERTAHFLLELATRFKALGLADERSYKIPLTQPLIGDTLGLSVPHVNRVLRRLRDERLVSIEEQRVTIMDFDALAELAHFNPGYLSCFSPGEMFDG
jgi:CRP-like cAMP-binding protein